MPNAELEMPYSFTKIEKEKTKTIYYGVALIFVFYFFVTWVLFAITRLAMALFIYLEIGRHTPKEIGFQMFWPNVTETLIMLGVALALGLVHLSVSVRNITARIMKALRAKPLDPSNVYHKQFQNILEELSAAAGGQPFEGWVVPSMSINAFAVTDINQRSVIGVTEGLLVKLKRPQIEAILGHEAAHILAGDSFENSLTVAMFDLHLEFLKDMKNDIVGSDMSVIWFSIVVGFTFTAYYCVLLASATAGSFLNMFLLRQREFRADAVAVRLTRDPLSLAEGLYLASRHWHGAGIAGERFSPLFIVAPRYNDVEESTGIWADLFATHPPVDQRLSILLDMAHLDRAAFEESLAGNIYVQLSKVKDLKSENNPKWFLRKESQWIGPHNAEEISKFDWIRPGTLVKEVGELAVVTAGTQRILGDLIKNRTGGKKDIYCPQCYKNLVVEEYEGQRIAKCPKCDGVLADKKDVYKILTVRQHTFSDQIIYLAEFSKFEKVQDKDVGATSVYANHRFACPLCQNFEEKMVRKFFNEKYHVEIDQCGACGAVWFDKDELETLQYLYEKRDD